MCTPYLFRNQFSNMLIYINSCYTENKNLQNDPYALAWFGSFYINHFGFSVYPNWKCIALYVNGQTPARNLASNHQKDLKETYFITLTHNPFWEPWLLDFKKSVVECVWGDMCTTICTTLNNKILKIWKSDIRNMFK